MKADTSIDVAMWWARKQVFFLIPIIHNVPLNAATKARVSHTSFTTELVNCLKQVRYQKKRLLDTTIVCEKVMQLTSYPSSYYTKVIL